MSLLLILRKIWKYKLVTFPILAFVLVGSFYVVAMTAPTYQTSATYILVNPGPPPTETQIARNPALGRINWDNPYTRFSDQAVLAQLLASRLSNEESRSSLVKQGADPGYTAAPSAEFGFSAPILEITGTGTTPAAALKTTDLVGRALTRQLDQMQEQRNVDERYRITMEAVATPGVPTLKASGKLRRLVAVLVLGVILLFVAISVLEALGALRAEWGQGRVYDGPGAGAALEPRSAPDNVSFLDPDPIDEQWPREMRR